MPRRSYGTEHALLLPREDHPDAIDGGACDGFGGVQGSWSHGGVQGHVDETRSGNDPIQGIEVGLRVDPCKIGPLGKASLVYVDVVEDSGLFEVLKERRQAFRALRMTGVHFMLKANVVGDEGSQ